jgi:hypothetical protein
MRDQERVLKIPEPCGDSSEVVADGGENGVADLPGAAFEIAAAETWLEVADPGSGWRAAASRVWWPRSWIRSITSRKV